MERYILIGIMAIIYWEINRRLNKIESSLFSIELRLREKVDKPTELDKLMEERKKQPKLSKEELNKVMTPEEKEYWKKINGTGYPTSLK